MISTAILLATFLGFVILFIKPKWGSFIAWFILFTYPHSWWFHHSFLPLNIGVDDLFCILLFLVVFVRRNILAGIPLRFGYGLGVISSFVLVATIANLSGMADGVAGNRMIYIKDTLKLGVYWCLFYAIIHCIDDTQDLRQQFILFSGAAVLGAILVVLHYYYPVRMLPWSNPQIVYERGISFEGRATGPFLNANGAACVLTCSLALVITALRLQERWRSKLWIFGYTAILLIGILVTKSRSGLMALVGLIFLMAMMGQNKKVALSMIMTGIIIAVLFTGVRQMYSERVAQVYDPTGGTWGKNVVGRFDTWKAYFETATAKTYVLGQGPRQGTIVNGSEPHSAYVGLITIYGFGGILWAILALKGFVKRVLATNEAVNPVLSIVGAGCMWGLVAWGIYACASDALSSQYPRFLLFYFVALIDRTAQLRRQENWDLTYGNIPVYEQDTLEDPLALDPNQEEALV